MKQQRYFDARAREKAERASRRHIPRGFPLGVVVGVLAALVAPVTHAFEFSTGQEDLKARWDNTIKYSAARRLKDPSPVLTADVNQDDGDRNFKKGLISNRVDLLSEFDLTYRNTGFRLSGAAWYDSVYNQANDNNSPFTVNSLSVGPNQFTRATKELHGRKAELLDAVVFGKAELGDMVANGRVGKHTLLYGESLFFGGNGVAAAQAPIDYIKMYTVPNTQFKEMMMPVQQVSGQLQINRQVTVGGYYQLKWVRDRIPASGSYFGAADIMDAGGESMLLGPGFSLTRGDDVKARDSGQGGMMVRIRPENQDIEYGLYAARFHAKDPVVYMNFFGPNTYQLVYPEDIKVLGASFTTNIGKTNFAAEASMRSNMPLASRAGGVALFAPGFDNRDNPAYPVGRTFHAQASVIGLLHASSFWQGGSFLGEIAFNRTLSVTRNAAALDPNSTRDATAMRLIFSPAYYQVIDGVDVNIPIGLGYGISGRSSAIGPSFGLDRGGDFSIGISADYRKVWKFGVSYMHFFGPEDLYLTPANSPAPTDSYKQNYKDRDFISITFQHTF